MSSYWQDVDWSSGRHQRECSAVASVGSREEAMKFPADFFLMVHAINRLRNNETADVDACVPPIDRTFNVLLSHSDDMKNNADRMSVFEEVKGKVVRCLGENLRLDEEMLLRIYGCLQINCFGIRDPFFMERGEGLYLDPSIIDHSCERNATFLFDGLNITIKAFSDIKAFEDSRISYTELFVPTCVRKRRFTKNYFFDCRCRLCDGSSFADLFPVRCDNVHCSAAVPTEERALLPCSSCGQNPACTAEQLDRSSLLMRRHLEGVEENDDRITIAEFSLTEILDDFDIIRARCEKVLHRDNMLLGMVQDRRGRLLSTMERYDEAFAAFQQSLTSMRKFFSPNDIKFALQLLKTALSAFLSGSYLSASLFLAEAARILKVCEGSSRPLVVLANTLLERLRDFDGEIYEADPDCNAPDHYFLVKSLLALLCNVRMEEKFLDVEDSIVPYLDHQ
ncbi:hypothetical protein RvY_14662 [Ramazzottius varieornatus]|uniref:SET domain-containing protein n=1 Tax=Ramazzottius varieornatus TaxID=947166 RepID=A0A1D1VZC3_RAMVA|nr:hypothetical protein RvY_14662 [Ramazzottius varieornatus]